MIESRRFPEYSTAVIPSVRPVLKLSSFLINCLSHVPTVGCLLKMYMLPKTYPKTIKYLILHIINRIVILIVVGQISFIIILLDSNFQLIWIPHMKMLKGYLENASLYRIPVKNILTI